MRGIINLNWTAQPLTDTQKLVVMKLAILWLRRNDGKNSVFFTHEEVEGRLTKKGRGVLGALSGTLFHVDFDRVHGENWTLDFLLPVGAENLEFGDDDILLSFKNNKDGTVSATFIDPSHVRVGAISLAQ